MENTAGYAVGRGKPPEHTRFKKGQSGNPSGKPGPAKLAKRRFQRALYAALEEETMELMLAKPRGALAQMARQLTLDAAAGRVSSTRLLLSLLDDEIASKLEREESEDVEEGEETSEQDAREAPSSNAAKARNEPPPFSLVQGKKQGSGKNITARTYEQVIADETLRKAGTEARRRTALLSGAAAIPSGGPVRTTSPATKM